MRAPGAGVRKPPKEETAGRNGRCFGWARPMGIGVADEALVGLRELVAGILRGWNEDDERVGGGSCRGLASARRLEKDCRAGEDSALMFRRAA